MQLEIRRAGVPAIPTPKLVSTSHFLDRFNINILIVAPRAQPSFQTGQQFGVVPRNEYIQPQFAAPPQGLQQTAPRNSYAHNQFAAHEGFQQTAPRNFSTQPQFGAPPRGFQQHGHQASTYGPRQHGRFPNTHARASQASPVLPPTQYDHAFMQLLNGHALSRIRIDGTRSAPGKLMVDGGLKSEPEDEPGLWVVEPKKKKTLRHKRGGKKLRTRGGPDGNFHNVKKKGV